MKRIYSGQYSILGLVSFPWIVLHAGHFDPVSPDPLISFSIRTGIAALAGLIAAGVTLVPIQYLWNGDVLPVLFTASVTKKPVLDISDTEYWTATGFVGLLLGALSHSLAIAIFGLPAIVLTAFDLIPIQVLTAGVLSGVVLFVGGGFVLLSRYGGDIQSHGAIRRTWLLCTSVFVITFILGRMGIFYALYGGYQ